MPRRSRVKRRKLAASPPSLGAKIVTEDMADASPETEERLILHGISGVNAQPDLPRFVGDIASVRLSNECPKPRNRPSNSVVYVCTTGRTYGDQTSSSSLSVCGEDTS
nr:unnamed protein product [Spirometra erinaceieuropaei]